MWLPTSENHLVMVKQIIGYLHSSSLMIDDIEDGSPMRRGCPAAHLVHGAPLTMNAANYGAFLVCGARARTHTHSLG